MAAEIIHDYAVYSQHMNVQAKLTNGSGGSDGKEEKGGLITSDAGSDVSDRPSLRLSLLSSNIQAEKETCLRSFLTKRLERMHPLEGNGNIASIPAGKVYEINAMVYFYMMTEDGLSSPSSESLPDASKRTFLVCFIAGIESGLELFQGELDGYCQLLSPYIHKYMESVDVSEYLKRLEAWYEINICFIQRCFSYLDQNLAAVLFVTFLGADVKMTGIPEEAKEDLNNFIDCCSLSELLQDKHMDPSISTISISKSSTDPVLEISLQDGKYEVSNERSNPFCRDCIKSMKHVGFGDPFKLRQVVENYKLKVIQDMNAFKRLTKQAETDYYALYRCFSFLISCDNGEILLKNAKAQCEDDNNKGCRDVLNVIQKFIDSKLGFEGIYKEEKSKMKTQHLLRLLNC